MEKPQANNLAHEIRRAIREGAGVRSTKAIVVSFVLLAITVALLLAVSWVPTDVRGYIATRPNILLAESQHLHWEMSDPVDDCFWGRACLDTLTATPIHGRTLAGVDEYANASGGERFVLVRLVVASAAFAPINGKEAIVLFPRFNFSRAEVYSEGRLLGTYVGGELVRAALSRDEIARSGQVTMDLVMALAPTGRSIAGFRFQDGVILGSLGEIERYRDFIGVKSSKAAGSLGELTKIVLALFCILLFLIVDSSPESFGLALFMGFEAAAMGVGHGWLPLGYLGIARTGPFVNFCYQMGDITKLYFLLQMARVSRPSAARWLYIGTALSIPYGFFMQYAGEHQWTWTHFLALGRDTFVGTVGAALCARAAWQIRKKGLRWRTSALVIAGMAAAFEVFDSWIAHSAAMSISPGLRTVFTVCQANCGYLFALSTFLNISTLENRVKLLTKEKARADEIERELAVGQIVQQALLKPPALPPEIDLTCHHEAALYVSGDTYYAHWDEAAGIMTFLVNDVTGHGVQAALKASACNVLAKTIWEDERRDRAAEVTGARLTEYDRVTTKLLVEMNTTPDFNSLVGAEFNAKTGELALYRSNFTFPIIIEPLVELTDGMEPVLGEFWKPDVVVSRNQQLLKRQIKRGTFVLFLSDGFLESSRETKMFAQYLRKSLAQRQGDVGCVTLTEMILRYEGFKNRKVIDDRTLLAFQWTLPSRKAASADPGVWLPIMKTGSVP